MKPLTILAVVFLLVSPIAAQAPPAGRGAPPPAPREAAAVDLTGYELTADVKLTLGVNVDFVICDSGRTRCVFDAGGNHYRLVCDVHYLKQYPEKGRVYVLRVMDHAEYDKELWKRDF